MERIERITSFIQTPGAEDPFHDSLSFLFFSSLVGDSVVAHENTSYHNTMDSVCVSSKLALVESF